FDGCFTHKSTFLMPLLIENIGFPAGGALSFMKIQHQVMNYGNLIYTPQTMYMWYSPGEGIEIWSRQAEEGNKYRLYAHYAGNSRMRVALVEKRPCKDGALADGLFVAYFKHKEGEGLETVHERLRYGDGTYTGVIPFVFSVPNYNWYSEVEMPLVTDVQITAFPFDLTGYETEDDWFDFQLEEQRKQRKPDEPEDPDPGYYRAASFIPQAAFFEKKSEDDFPSPTATLSGIVLETAILTNPVTGQDFSWAKIETAAGDIDLVVNPEILEGYLVEGGVAAGCCYLSGRLPEFAPDI
ncbi:MAG TPA: hypothetical protein VKB86_11555, partial [Pyrinomonadaceae bacterium]|nr:hypothetical protein [Pyrinomonadaceae bacterium]